MLFQRGRTTLPLLGVLLILTACSTAPVAERPTVATTAAATPLAATGAPISAPQPAVEPAYLDDRSNAEAVINSFYNAVNRREYARAYGYWQADAPDLAPYEAFAHGYATTSAVEIRYGTVTGDSGAGQTYFSVPVSITAQTGDGTQYFVGCYTLHESNPTAQATPPFQPLAIASALVERAPAAPTHDAIGNACQAQGAPIPAQDETGNIDQSVYIDNRSGPVEALHSFYNAINRHEYIRAYGYWQYQAQVPALPTFTEGYSATQSVALITGDVQSEAGAGQRYYRVPVTITAQLNDGSAQTFAGCYFLHSSSPAIQEPPFTPLGIDGANVQQVTGSATATDLMAQNCRVSR